MADVSRFWSCYLLTSLKEGCSNHSYIGFTVNPQRRLRQHNGEIVNGAQKTSPKRPWEMIVVIYGFPSKKEALYFEWAWQKPFSSKRLRSHLASLPLASQRLGNRHHLKFKIRVLYEMLQQSPWNRYPLTLHWLGSKNPQNSTFSALFSTCPSTPRHMNHTIGPVTDLEKFYGSKSGINEEMDFDELDFDDNTMAIDHHSATNQDQNDEELLDYSTYIERHPRLEEYEAIYIHSDEEEDLVPDVPIPSTSSNSEYSKNEQSSEFISRTDQRLMEIPSVQGWKRKRDSVLIDKPNPSAAEPRNPSNSIASSNVSLYKSYSTGLLELSPNKRPKNSATLLAGSAPNDSDDDDLLIPTFKIASNSKNHQSKSPSLRTGPTTQTAFSAQTAKASFTHSATILPRPIVSQSMESSTKKSSPLSTSPHASSSVPSTGTANFNNRIDTNASCFICKLNVQHINNGILCSGDNCHAYFHITCLAKTALQAEKSSPENVSNPASTQNHLIPTTSQCPQCNQTARWMDLVRFKKRMAHQNLIVQQDQVPLPPRSLS